MHSMGLLKIRQNVPHIGRSSFLIHPKSLVLCESLAVTKFFKDRACHLGQATQSFKRIRKRTDQLRKTNPNMKIGLFFPQVMNGVGNYTLVTKSLCSLVLELANAFSHQHIQYSIYVLLFIICTEPVTTSTQNHKLSFWVGEKKKLYFL